ncbi:hypothetical protein M3Y94_01286100 [Aphelenchoides besseyi]|nr:hypothetical protein M3Y94_01286100 [Aphelenchoides besseyi]KAI6222785.1 ShKT domain-containing protein [Aphelenchoides besseyi]
MNTLILIFVLFGNVSFAQRLPTAFSGVVQEEQIQKKNAVPQLPTIPNSCFNEHECCESLQTMGACVHHRADLKLWCPLSCGYCQANYDQNVDCADRYHDCKSKVKGNGCKQNEYWMNENCRKTCDRCKKTRAETCPGQRLDCSKAPNLAIRRYCEQLQRWDEGARHSQLVGPEVALPPGSHTLADLAP